MTDAIALLCLLIGLELVLGVDNVLVLAILVGRLSEAQRQLLQMRYEYNRRRGLAGA
jgi:predicted tellurium resistance membrane protein TerC